MLYSCYFGHYILAIYIHYAVFGRTKSSVQYGAFFGVVDKVATEVFFDSLFKVTLVR